MRGLVIIGLIDVLILILIGEGLYVYQAYAKENISSPSPNAAVGREPLAPGNVVAEGTIVPSRYATLAFKIGGDVSEVRVKEGDIAAPGAVLVRLIDSDLRNQAKQAEAAQNVARAEFAQLRAGATQSERQAAQDALAAAQAKYDAAKRTSASEAALKEATAALSQAKSGVARLDASSEAIAVAQARLDQAQAAYDGARGSLEQASLTAPFSGTVAQVKVNVGDFIGPGMPVVTIGDLSKLVVESNDISDLDIARVKVGQSVGVTLDAFPNQIFHGTVARISPVANESRGYKVFRVWISLKEGIESGLRWGMDAKIEVFDR
jgi:multidrug efflux pump subunit AcrA (membrane-fusion protein)